MVIHPFPPIWNTESRILILGSFPSVKSRDEQFFYGHPRNRFWKVLAAVYEDPLPETIPQKRAFLLKHHIALWDVIASCDIDGSSDSSIRNVVPNDVSSILSASKIESIYLNGKTAQKFYNRYLRTPLDQEAICLPSTSPANAAWSLEKLIHTWRIIQDESSLDFSL